MNYFSMLVELNCVLSTLLFLYKRHFLMYVLQCVSLLIVSLTGSCGADGGITSLETLSHGGAPQPHGASSLQFDKAW